MKVTLKMVQEFMNKNSTNKLIMEQLLQGKEFCGIIKQDKDNYKHILSQTEDLIETTAHLEFFLETLEDKVYKELDLIQNGSKFTA